MVTNTEAVHDRRCAIVRLLAGGAERSSLALHQFLNALGHTVGLPAIEADLAWLSDRELLTTDKVGGVLLAKLTPAGERLARPGAARQERAAAAIALPPQRKHG